MGLVCGAVAMAVVVRLGIGLVAGSGVVMPGVGLVELELGVRALKMCACLAFN